MGHWGWGSIYHSLWWIGIGINVAQTGFGTKFVPDFARDQVWNEIRSSPCLRPGLERNSFQSVLEARLGTKFVPVRA